MIIFLDCSLQCNEWATFTILTKDFHQLVLPEVISSHLQKTVSPTQRNYCQDHEYTVQCCLLMSVGYLSLGQTVNVKKQNQKLAYNQTDWGDCHTEERKKVGKKKLRVVYWKIRAAFKLSTFWFLGKKAAYSVQSNRHIFTTPLKNPQKIHNTSTPEEYSWSKVSKDFYPSTPSKHSFIRKKKKKSWLFQILASNCLL